MVKIDAYGEEGMSQARMRFAEECESAVMTVLKDDGVYRHLRFDLPKASWTGFEVVTWPEVLWSGAAWAAGPSPASKTCSTSSAGTRASPSPRATGRRSCFPTGESAMTFAADRVPNYIAQAVADVEAQHPGLAGEAEAYFLGCR